jgi:transposase
VQRELLIGWHEMPTAPGHVFYDHLNAVLAQTGFDREVEALCQPHYANGIGPPSIPPGRNFRMLFVGYFKGLVSERGIAWRCADSLSPPRLRSPTSPRRWRFINGLLSYSRSSP